MKLHQAHPVSRKRRTFDKEDFSIPLTRVDKIEVAISYVLKLLMIVAAVAAFLSKDYFYIFSALLALLASSMPAILGRRWQLVLPTEIDFTVTIFIFVHFILGELGGYYDRYWWFDLILHSYSGFVFALVGFVWAYLLFFTQKVKANPIFLTVFSISLAMGVSAIWEIFEFSMDQLLGFNMQRSGLVDTMWDLIVAFAGSLVIGFAGYGYQKSSKDGFMRRILRRTMLYHQIWKRRTLNKKLKKQKEMVRSENL